jgi:hypothetical protein
MSGILQVRVWEGAPGNRCFYPEPGLAFPLRSKSTRLIWAIMDNELEKNTG